MKNKHVCIIRIILIISDKETADKAYHSAKHQQFPFSVYNHALLTKVFNVILALTL